jgi:hypothetical protein
MFNLGKASGAIFALINPDLSFWCMAFFMMITVGELFLFSVKRG